MIIIGLTGSIASGKSTIASRFRLAKVPIFDSDAEIHKLLGPSGEAVDAVISQFGDLRDDEGAIDRPKLGKIVFSDTEALQKLESLLHPLIAKKREKFLAIMQANRKKAVLLDVPLLFETGTDAICDVTMMSWAPDYVIYQRAMARPHMTAQKLAGILAKQLSQQRKKQLADVVIPTGLGYARMTLKLKKTLKQWQICSKF